MVSSNLSLSFKKGFPGGAVVKSLPANAGDGGDAGWILMLKRLPGEGNSYSLQYPCLKYPMNRRLWQATVHGVTNSQTQLKQLSTHTQ